MWNDLYKSSCVQQGKIECVEYTSRAYALEAVFEKEIIPTEKKMWIYTPYQYDESKQYDVLFLMHGGTDDEGYWFGKGRYNPEDTKIYTTVGNITQNVLDHLIYEKKIKPLIVVAASFNEEVEPYISQPNRAVTYFENSNYFWMELRNEIMPYIQKHYATYAKRDSEKELVEAREHFGYIGASQGSITGQFSVMMHCLDMISYIGCLSAGCIKYEYDGKNVSVEMDKNKYLQLEQTLSEGMRISYWYNGCGDNDFMYKTHKQTFECLCKDLPEKLVDGQNCCFVTHPEGIHHYSCWIQEFEKAILCFFHS